MMTGIPKKKENSAEALRETPSHNAPMIVAPERDVPGINAKHCNSPICSAVTRPISSASSAIIVLGLFST